MKIKNGSLFFIVILLICGISLVWVTVKSDPVNINAKSHEAVTFSNTEKAYLAEKDQLQIVLSDDLDYMEQGFLAEYLQSVLEPSGLHVRIAEGDADAQLVIMDDVLRSKTDVYQFTAPILQTEASLFVSDEYEQGTLSGVYVKGELSQGDIKNITYNGNDVDFTAVDSTRDAVNLAGEANLDCIAGNQAAITAYLKEAGLEAQYNNQYAALFDYNISLVVPAEEDTLYSILNLCIQSADLTMLAKQAQEHWYGIADSYIDENGFEDAVVLILIIIIAVMITFFIYYQSNKNLYSELTERMEQLTASKQELKTTFNGVSYYLAELNPDGIILDINTAFLNFVNKECVGRYIGDVLEIPTELHGLLDEMMAVTVGTGEGTNREITLKRHIYEINIFPIKPQKGEIEKLLFMAGDVTNERMAERQMLQDNKMIAVGQLAAGVAHEIRNPLGIIRNYCYVLKNMKDEEVQKQAVQVIERSVDTAGNIIDTLLNFSKISNHRIEEVYLKEHVDSVIMLNIGLLKKKQISFAVSCEEDFKVNLAIDSFDMVFINLVTNAIDAMNETGHLQIDISRNDEEYSVAVTDNGSGIDEDIMDDIFNPFFTTKSTVEGNGLGLYIVYNEIQKMNGQIQVTSKAGEGTTFHVTLPFRLEDEAIE